MLMGVDTTFLVQVEASEHPDHDAARTFLRRHLREGGTVALAPQVLAEFVHVIVDSRRFERPLSPPDALERAAAWWNASETERVLPTERAVTLFFRWMVEFRLGRKRLLDTLLAATYAAAGVRVLVTSNVRDFQRFGVLEVVVPR